jgi:hypothetical protein
MAMQQTTAVRTRSQLSRVLQWFPLLIVAVIVYNILAFTAPALSGATMDTILSRGVSFTMFSGDVLRFTLGDILVLFALALLFVEVVKSTGTGATQVLNHAMSMLTFVLALIEFLLVPGFSTMTFFFITMMALFDVVAGFTVSIVAAKRDLGATHGLIGTN